MIENDQATSTQDPQYAAPQQTNQQPPYIAPQQNGQQPQYTVPQQPSTTYPQTATTTDNAKLYSILSYIGILWLIGLLGSQKDNPSVRFHVNQGIILSIFAAAICIVAAILNTIIGGIFTENYYGLIVYTSPTGIHLQHLISYIASAVILVGTIIGAVNASQGKEQPLPVIGKLLKIIK